MDTEVTSVLDLTNWTTNTNLIFKNNITITDSDNFSPLNLSSQNININGNGFTIYIQTTNIKIWTGLFTINSVVNNISIINLNLNFATYIELQANMGAIIGSSTSYVSKNAIIIANSSVIGNLNCYGAGCGALLGNGLFVDIINSCSQCMITGIGAGGIVGSNCSGQIMNCFSSGEISGLGSGGIVGSYSACLIVSCYSTGNIKNASGGIAGTNMLPNYINNCYTLGDLSGASGGIIAGNTVNSNKILPSNIQVIYIYNCYTFGLVGNDCGSLGGVNSYNIQISYFYSMNGLDLGIDAMGLILSGSITNMDHTGVGNSPDWIITSADLFNPITGYLTNNTSIGKSPKNNNTTGATGFSINSGSQGAIFMGNIWCDTNLVSPPVENGPPILTVFTKNPWNHTQCFDIGLPSVVTPTPNLPTPYPIIPVPTPTKSTNVGGSGENNQPQESWHIWVAVIVLVIVIVLVAIVAWLATKSNKLEKEMVEIKTPRTITPHIEV